MLRMLRPVFVAALVAPVAAFVTSDALAQAKGSGKIVCWKDKSGKVIGCGDTVPPEYQDAATKELDRRGVTRGTTESAEQQAKTRAQEAELKKKREEEQKRLAEQKRQDAALLATFSNEKEIDLKRDRELQTLDNQLTQLKGAHKNAIDREKDVQTRIATTAKGGKPATDTQKEDLARTEADRKRAEQNLAAKQKELDDVRKNYADMKKRYMELKGITPAASAAPAPTTAAPAKK